MQLQKGPMLPGEMTQALQSQAREKLQKWVKDKDAKDRKSHRIEDAMAGASVDNVLKMIHGNPVFVREACRLQAVAEAVESLRMMVVRMSNAEVFIVVTPGCANHSITLASTCRGFYEVSLSVVLAKCGVAIKMAPIFHVTKVLYISPRMAAAEADFAAFARRVVAVAPSL